MSILAMRTAIVTRLQEAFPALAEHIKPHFRTKISAEDIDRCLTHTHFAMRVSFAGVLEDADSIDHELRAPETWVVYLIVKDRTGKKSTGDLAAMRDETLLTLLPEILRVVVDDGFEMVETTTGDTINFKPKSVRAVPVYEGEPDESVSSALVWAIRWTETALIPPADSDDIRPFTTLTTNYELTPEDDENDFEATDTITLEQP
jgi:hypothetical protein